MKSSRSTSSSSVRRANRSASPATGSAAPTRAAIWPLSPSALLAEFARAGWSSKTCPASCRLTAGAILAPSSGRWQNSGMGSPAEFLTLSSLEFHSGAVASSLSDVLEAGDLPQRFFLSATACAGILRRAAKRGKELPQLLKAALAQAAQDGAPTF
jgi:hypothetical protein